MADREKVIKGIEYCKKPYCQAVCPYAVTSESLCCGLDPLLDDVLELLKEQEQRINFLEERLRLLEYGDQGTLQSGLMPAT